VPFSDESAVVVERTDGAGPPRRGWQRDANRSSDAPGGLLAGVVWLLSRHGRFGRAMVLHEHLRERRDTGEELPRPARGRRPAVPGLAVGAVRQIRQVLQLRQLPRSRRRTRAGVAAGLVAVPLALPAVAVVLAAIVVLLVVDVALWAVLAVGASIRTAAGARLPKEAAPASLDWTPSSSS
jgi:hypothetical protein